MLVIFYQWLTHAHKWNDFDKGKLFSPNSETPYGLFFIQKCDCGKYRKQKITTR